jgi:hypothetical protein
MEFDSQASLLACTFVSPYLGHELKARVATFIFELAFESFKEFKGASILLSMTKQREVLW